MWGQAARCRGNGFPILTPTALPSGASPSLCELCNSSFQPSASQSHTFRINKVWICQFECTELSKDTHTHAHTHAHSHTHSHGQTPELAVQKGLVFAQPRTQGLRGPELALHPQPQPVPPEHPDVCVPIPWGLLSHSPSLPWGWGKPRGPRVCDLIWGSPGAGRRARRVLRATSRFIGGQREEEARVCTSRSPGPLRGLPPRGAPQPHLPSVQ